MNKAKREKIIEVVWFLVIVALFIVSIKMIRSGELQTFVASFGIWAPLVVIVLKMATLVVAPLGGTPLYLLSGALFGNFWGFVICFLGDVLGSVACFGISRRYGARVVKFFAGEKFFAEIQKFLSLLGSTKSFIKARVALFTLPEIFAYAAGLGQVRFIKFFFIHSIFMAPLALVGVFFGSQVALLTAKYSIFAVLLGFLVIIGGLSMLWKDYEKAEGM